MSAEAGVRGAMERLLATAAVAATSVTTRIGAGSLHHLELGDGPPIVLVHGGSGGGANWFRMMPLLAGYRVLAPDLPGFGLSDPVEPGNRPGAQAARILGEWADVQGLGEAVWAGTSFGGLAAMHVCRLRPELCRGLFLAATAGIGRRVNPVARLATLPLIGEAAARPTRAGTRLLFRRLLTTDRSGMPVDQQEALVDYLFQVACRAGPTYGAVTLRRFSGPGGQRDVWSAADVESLGVPISVVWGRRDRLLPLGDALALARHAPAVRLHVLEGVGHSPNWERPDAVARPLRALATGESAHDVASP